MSVVCVYLRDGTELLIIEMGVGKVADLLAGDFFLFKKGVSVVVLGGTEAFLLVCCCECGRGEDEGEIGDVL